MTNSASPDLGFSPKGLFIGGGWEEAADGRTFESINPANGEHLGDVPLAGGETGLRRLGPPAHQGARPGAECVC